MNNGLPQVDSPSQTPLYPLAAATIVCLTFVGFVRLLSFVLAISAFPLPFSPTIPQFPHQCPPCPNRHPSGQAN